MSKNGNKANVTEGVKRGRVVVVSIKALVQAMLPIIEKGNISDPKGNTAECARALNVKETTILNKIRKFRKEYPQFQLIDTTYFTGRQGPPREHYTDEELDAFFAKALNKSVTQIRQEVSALTTETEQVEEEVASGAS
jgi:hypothetical protein